MSFGQELPDQVEALDRRTDAQLVLLSDVQSLIRERAALEVQYSKSLQATAKKAEKLLQAHSAGAVMGENPSKGVTPDIVSRSTLHSALSFFADSLDRAAQEHMSFSEVLTIQVADDLKALGKKKEETRKKHSAFYSKLVSERDVIYNGRTKAQAKYYSQCDEAQALKQKQGLGNDKHADRAARQLEEAETGMFNAKNTYLISVSVANKVKDQFYSVNVPEIEDQYQLLQTSIASRLSYILSNYCAFNTSHLSTLTQMVETLRGKVQEVDHQADDELFIDLNRRPFNVPNDWTFEPCPTFYETPEMCVEPEPKILLQNKLARSQVKLAESRPILKAKETEANRLKDLSVKYAEDPNLGSSDTALDDAFEAFHAASQLELACAGYEEEVAVIAEAVGDDVGGTSPHSFKDSSFAVPTTCGFCQTSIWGLTKQGKTCKKCGLSVHAKCELKVPAQCSNTKDGGAVTVARHKSSHSKNKLSVNAPSAGSAATPKSSSMSSQSSASSHSFAKSQGAFLTSSSTLASSSSNSTEPDGIVIFDFTGSSTFELSASAGTPIWLVEGGEDDGSGWMKVSDGKKTGLVPTSYLQMNAAGGGGTAKRASVGTGKKAKALYDYAAQGDDELSLAVGSTVTLTPNGETYADGWYEGIDSSGNKGVFPSNYVKFI